MPLSLKNSVEAGIIDRLLNGTLNLNTAKKIPGITIENKYPLRLRYKEVGKKLSKPSQKQNG